MPRVIAEVKRHNPVEILRLAGRCANGGERDGGALYHAVRGYCALCGAKPGKRSAGWSMYPGERENVEAVR
jgi:hypothetical protein